MSANSQRKAGKLARNEVRHAANEARRWKLEALAALGNQDAVEGLRARIEGRRRALAELIAFRTPPTS